MKKGMIKKIIFNDVSMSFGKLKVLDNISFSISEGEFVSIIGPSGCGKTTLLYLINRFRNDYHGVIKTYGKIGFIFQDHNLFPWMNVLENIGVGPINSNRKNSEIHHIVQNLLKEINMKKFQYNYPHQLSGGMKQKVSIARCLANNPDILLMDEPSNSLDYFTKRRIYDFILNLWKKKNLTILLVTHDIEDALRLSTKIIILSDRPAKIIATLHLEDDRNIPRLKDKILSMIEKGKD